MIYNRQPQQQQQNSNSELRKILQQQQMANQSDFLGNSKVHKQQDESVVKVLSSWFEKIYKIK